MYLRLQTQNQANQNNFNRDELELEYGACKRLYSLAISKLDRDTGGYFVAAGTQFSFSNILEWISNFRFIGGRQWSFDSSEPKIELGAYDIVSKVLRRPYLYKYLQDQSPEKSIIKPRQAELSENSINEILFYCLTRPFTRASHVFPTDGIADGFSIEKINPAIVDSPGIASLTSKFATRRYAFKNGSLYTTVGALKKAGGRAGSRDIVVFDEYDFMPESIMGVYEELMSHSGLRLVRKLSTPTVPLVGIDKAVKQGSMNEWIFNCAKCGEEQFFSFPDNLINFFEADGTEQTRSDYESKLNKVYIGCKKCSSYIDRNSDSYINSAKWIAAKPELEGIRSSYSITAPMLAWKTGKEITRKYHRLSNYTWQFMNEVFGVAYIKGNNRLIKSEILECQRSWNLIRRHIPKMTSKSLGIDWGQTQSWVVLRARGFDPVNPEMSCIAYVEEINRETLINHGINPDNTVLAHVERVCQLVQLFDVQIIVNDANGIGIDRNKELLRRFPNRTWGAFFDTGETTRQMRSSKLIQPLWNSTGRRVTFSKLSKVKEIQNEFRRMAIGIPQYAGDDVEILRKFIDHHMNLGIQPRFNMEAEREYEIVTKFSDDHLFDANMYSSLGFEKLVGLGMEYQSPGVIGGSALMR